MEKGFKCIKVGDEVICNLGYWKGERVGKVFRINEKDDKETDEYIVNFPDRLDCVRMKESWIDIYDPEEMMDSMASVDGGFLNIKLGVWTGEGTIPHFHFYHGVGPDKGVNKEKKSGGGCICFLTPNYFSHGNHKETMNSKEIKELKQFLSSQHKHAKLTNWEYMIILWNSDNKQKQIPYGSPIPDYRSDMESIHK